MTFKSGDLAVIIGLREWPEHNGKIVQLLEPFLAESWERRDGASIACIPTAAWQTAHPGGGLHNHAERNLIKLPDDDQKVRFEAEHKTGIPA